jgi:hypothetical protein
MNKSPAIAHRLATKDWPLYSPDFNSIEFMWSQ